METKVTTNVYSLVTQTIIEQLEKGVIPWRQTWANSGMPQNLLSKRSYRGVNLLLLSFLGYESNYFLTFKQLKSIGASVKKGEKAHTVVYNKYIDVEKDGKTEQQSVLRFYKVFNVSQCKDIRDELLGSSPKPVSVIKEYQDVFDLMVDKPYLQHIEKEAWYNPRLDTINLPTMEVFESSLYYYETLFHELIHATGHKSRLNRKEVVEPTHYASYEYSLEELVAEIGASFLMSICGKEMHDIENASAYIGGWLKKLQNDRSCIIKASSRAQKAVEYIFNPITQIHTTEVFDDLEDCVTLENEKPTFLNH